MYQAQGWAKPRRYSENQSLVGEGLDLFEGDALVEGLGAVDALGLEVASRFDLMCVFLLQR